MEAAAAEPDPEMVAQIESLQGRIREMEAAESSAQIERDAQIQDQIKHLESISSKNLELVSSVVNLEGRIKEMGSVASKPVPDPAQAERIAELEGRIREMEAAAAEPDPEMVAQIESLQGRIREMEAAESSAQIERDAQIQDQIKHLESISSKNLELVSSVVNLEGRIKEMGSVASKPVPDPAQAERIAELEGRIKEMEAAAAEPDPEMVALVGVLQDKMSEMEDAPPPEPVPDPAQAERIAELEGRIKEMEAAAAEPDPEMVALVGVLQDRMSEMEDAPPPKPVPDPAQAERIAELLEDIKHLEATSTSNAELLRVIGKLEERIAHVESDVPSETAQKPFQATLQVESDLLSRIDSLQTKISQLESLPAENIDGGIFDQLTALQKMITSYKRNAPLDSAHIERLTELHVRVKKLRAAYKRRTGAHRTARTRPSS